MNDQPDELSTKIARSLDLLVRLQLEEVKGARNQTDLVRFLANLGANAAEIASLTNLKRTTVDPILSRVRASAKPKKQKSAARKRGR